MAVKRKKPQRKKAATKKPVPMNKRLYSSVKSAVKRKFKVYPSAYANAFLVKEYKRRGGKYRMGVKK